MLNPALIDYVVVHELAHFAVRNHSAVFWRLVEETMPDAKHRRRYLHVAGQDLPL